MQTPAEQLRGRLALYRERGVSFEAAWRRALVGLHWPSGGEARDQWLAAFAATEHQWRLAYAREPSECDVFGVLDPLVGEHVLAA